MRLLSQVRRCLIVGATLGLLMPQVSFAVERNQVPPIRDVALQHGGILRGEVLSAQGQSASGQTISLATNSEVVANVVVGTDGKFAIAGLRPGVYSVAVGETQSVLRLWSETAAPPSATHELLLVDQQEQVVRGGGFGYMPQWNHPIVVSGLLLTAGVIGGVIGYNVRDSSPAS
jgi:hypothetical protein